MVSFAIMIIGLLINNAIYKKHDRRLIEVFRSCFGDEDAEIFISMILLMFVLFFMTIPVLNIMMSVALNVVLIINGAD